MLIAHEKASKTAVKTSLCGKPERKTRKTENKGETD